MKENTNKTTVVASVAGAVVGAGVGVAAAKVMSDKKLRDKVTGKISDFKNQVVDIIDEASNQNQISEKGGTASRKLSSGNKTSQKKSNKMT